MVHTASKPLIFAAGLLAGLAVARQSRIGPAGPRAKAQGRDLLPVG